MNSDINILKNLLSKGLYLDNLDDMIEICDCIIKKTDEPLPIYVLSSIFIEIYSSWNDRRVTLEEAKQIEKSLLPHIEKVITIIETSSDKSALWNALNSLIKANYP